MAAGCCASLALQRTGRHRWTPAGTAWWAIATGRGRPSAASDGERLCSAGRDRRDRSDELQGQQSTGFEPGGGAGFQPGQLCDVALSVAATAPTWIGTASVAMTAARRADRGRRFGDLEHLQVRRSASMYCCRFHPQARSRTLQGIEYPGHVTADSRLPRPRACACCRPSNARARGSPPSSLGAGQRERASASTPALIAASARPMVSMSRFFCITGSLRFICDRDAIVATLRDAVLPPWWAPTRCGETLHRMGNRTLIGGARRRGFRRGRAAKEGCLQDCPGQPRVRLRHSMGTTRLQSCASSRKPFGVGLVHSAHQRMNIRLEGEQGVAVDPAHHCLADPDVAQASRGRDARPAPESADTHRARSSGRDRRTHRPR